MRPSIAQKQTYFDFLQVFHAERVEVKNRVYHKRCASCFNCAKPLSSRDICDGKDQNIYCTSCYSRKYGAPGYRGTYDFHTRSHFLHKVDWNPFFLLQLFYWNYLLITGAGCGEWTDVDSAETLRPRQNNDLSKIKGEEGDINTCKRCQGKVRNFSKNADPIYNNLRPFFRSLKPKELHQRATPGTKSAFVASNVALL